MPTVPRLQPQARTEALPGARLSVDSRGAFGEDVGRGLQQLGAGVGQAAHTLDGLYREERAKADAVVVADAENALQREVTAALHDEKEGLFRKQGRSAFGQDAAVRERLAKRRQELEKGLFSEEQKRTFRLRSDSLLLSTDRQVESYLGQQREAAQALTLKDTEAQALDVLATEYSDAQARGTRFVHAESAIKALAASPEEGEARWHAWQKAAHQVVLEQYLSAGDAEGAESYLGKHREALGAGAGQFDRALGTLRKARELEAREKDAERTAAQAVELARDDATGWVREDQARAAVDSVPEGPLRDEVRERLRLRLAEEAKSRDDTVSAVFSRAFSSYLGKHSLSAVAPEDRAWLLQRAPEQWARLEDRARADGDRWRARQREGGHREDPKQQAAFIELQRDMTNRPEAYEGMSGDALVAKWGPLLSDTDMRAAGQGLVQLQKRRQELARRGGLVQDQEWRASLPTAAREAGITDQTSKKGRKAFDAFRGYLNAQRDAYVDAHNGEAPPRDLVDRWKAEAAASYVRERFLLPDQERRGYELTPAERASGDFRPAAAGEAAETPPAPTEPAPPRKVSTTAEIPAEERALVEAALRQAGRPVTDAEVLRVYLRQRERQELGRGGQPVPAGGPRGP